MLNLYNLFTLCSHNFVPFNQHLSIPLTPIPAPHLWLNLFLVQSSQLKEN